MLFFLLVLTDDQPNASYSNIHVDYIRVNFVCVKECGT